jgi:hypothetical protein
MDLKWREEEEEEEEEELPSRFGKAEWQEIKFTKT